MDSGTESTCSVKLASPHHPAMPGGSRGEMLVGEERARHRLSAAQPKVDRRALEEASKTLGIAARVWKLKMATGHCPVAKRMHTRGQWPSDKCLDCGQVETAEHVWVCPKRRSAWQKALTAIQDRLSSLHSDATLTKAFVSTLHVLRKDSVPTASCRSQLLNKAARDQQHIGLHRTMLGEISTCWGQ